MRSNPAKPNPEDGSAESESPDVAATPHSPRLFHLLAQAKQNLFRSADAVIASQLGYSGTQVVALFAIKSEEGCQLKDLGRLLQLKNSAVTGLVARLEDNELILRAPCDLDGRASRLRLSRKGNKVLDKALPLLDSLNAQLKQGFSAEELAVVARFLQQTASLEFRKEKS